MKKLSSAPTICSLLLIATINSSIAFAREFKTRDAIERALSSPITLSKAITIATDHVKGRPISAEIEDFNPLIAEIKIALPDGASKVMVDLQKGSLITDPEPLPAFKAFKYSRNYTALENAKLSLLEAIQIAENKTGGRVVEIKFTYDSGQYIYEIDSVAKDSYTDLSINANTREVIASKFHRAK